jgi:hypothetical protein
MSKSAKTTKKQVQFSPETFETVPRKPALALVLLMDIVTSETLRTRVDEGSEDAVATVGAQLKQSSKVGGDFSSLFFIEFFF